MNLPQRHLHFEACVLEGRSESIDFPQHQHQEAKAAGSCSISTAHHNYSERRNKNCDCPVENQQRQLSAAPRMDPVNPLLVNARLASHAADSPLKHELRSSSESVNTCHSSALTLGNLDPSNLESFQPLVQSSQISASLYCSVQRLEQETALMGIRGSLPLEPKSAPLVGHSRFAPDDLGPSILTMGEQLAAVKTNAAQARLKWGVPFAKDWSLSAVTRDFSPTEPLSVSHRYGHIGSNTWRANNSGGIQPQTLASGVGSGRPVDIEANSSFNCSPFSKSQSLVKPSPETGSLYVHRKGHSPGKVVKGEQTSNGVFPCVESWKKDLSASLDPEGLQVLLETDLGGAQMNVGVAMCGTPTEVCVSIAPHPGDKEFRAGHQLSVKSVQVNNSHVKYSKESEEVCDSRSQAARRVAAVGSSQSNPLGTPAEEGFNKHSDVDCMNMSTEGRRNKYSYQSSWRNLEADGNLEQSEECSVERNANKPRCCEEGSQTQKTVLREVRVCSL